MGQNHRGTSSRNRKNSKSRKDHKLRSTHRHNEKRSCAVNRKSTDPNVSKKARTHDKPIVIPPYAREELEARWERAGIENDYIFAVVMQDADLFLQLMQRILPELNLTHVTRHERQKVAYGAPDAKSVRYDVYSEINDIHFVVEMQMHNLPSLKRRTRYYQSLLDIQNLRHGADYRNLPDTFVIMICPFDLFGRGRHMYRFRYTDITDHDLELEDGTEKIFINSKGTADDISEDLQNFLDLINGKAPADRYCQQVADSVYEAKHAKEVKRMFMNVNLKQMEELYYARQEAAAQGRADGLAQGLAQGLDQGLAQGLTQGRAEEQQNSLRKFCTMVANGDLSMSAAVKNAADYGVTDETDLRRRAQVLGIKI